MNQSEIQVGLINKVGKNLFHKEMFEEIVRERFDEPVNSDSARKRLNDLERGIKLFEKSKISQYKFRKRKRNYKMCLNQI